MRAAGLSQFDLARPGLMLAALGAALLAVLSAYLLPAATRSFKDLTFEVRNKYASAVLQKLTGIRFRDRDKLKAGIESGTEATQGAERSSEKCEVRWNLKRLVIKHILKLIENDPGIDRFQLSEGEVVKSGDGPDQRALQGVHVGIRREKAETGERNKDLVVIALDDTEKDQSNVILERRKEPL